MLFEWDEKKNISNIKKHGISFQDAQAVFYDEHQHIILDNRKNYKELREITIGENANGNILITVVHTDRNGIIRIISVRKANSKEITLYYAHH
jgi:uncharacterized protein